MRARRLPIAAGWTLLVLAAGSAIPAAAQESQAMRFECGAADANTAAARQRAEQWVRDKLKAFNPSPEEALRMLRIQGDVQEVLLAFGSIASTCEQYRADKISKDVADRALHGFEQMIASFLHQLDNEMTVISAMAQVADMGRLRAHLTQTGGVGRQAALLGNDELAEAARKQMVGTLVRFSEAFVDKTCWDQVFDEELPFSLNQQNEMLGTGIDVRPCAQRRFRAVVPPLTFESCTLRGVGKWRVTWDMSAPGATGGNGSGELEQERDAAKGDYKVEWGANGAAYRASGDLDLTRKDNGAGRKPTYTLAGDMDIKLTKGEEMVKMMAKLMKQKVGGRQTFRVEPEVSEKPCKALE
jgi:hypothetical protein